MLWQIYGARCLLRALFQHRCHQVLYSNCDPSLKETLEMLDKIWQCPALDEKQVAMLCDVTQELENLRINEKKQTRIEYFFQKM